MNLKNEKALNQAVTQTNATRWEKIKKFSRKTLLATISTISIATGMLGSSQQMSAQAPQNYVTVNADNLDAYLNGNRSQTTTRRNQQQYAQVYANRDAYRQQQAQATYASPQWLEARGYIYDPMLSENLSRKYIGAFIDTQHYSNNRPMVVYLPADPVHDSPITRSMDDAKKMADYPGGDTLGIYVSPTGTDINNPENNYYGGYYSHPRTRTGRVIRDAVHIGHTMYHIINGHRHR